jgi:acyl-CoA dehydrogenase
MLDFIQFFNNGAFSFFAVIILLYFAYKGSSLLIFSLFTLFFLLVKGVSSIFIAAFIVINFMILYKPVRKILISKNIISLLRKSGMIPKISETEEIALRAGNVWIEGELFSGRPDFARILQEPYAELTTEEKDFLDGPVVKVCEMTDDWQVFQDKDLSKEVWAYLKKEKFFGMIIPKKYSGLGFQALAHSTVVEKLATRSQVLAITVMVPNSLGPAELLLRYGTEKQKDFYLPRLANGQEIPCFGLTEPLAGSDATSIKAEGVVFKDKDGKLKIRLNFRKRYITLGAVATVIGLAFKLKDPKNLLQKGEDLGITCALIKSKNSNIEIKRHDPLSVPFVNASLIGKDVIISVDDIIGGVEQAGSGWKMLMECLSIGRGISLPATSTGGAKMVARVVGNYARIRRQFGTEIGKFEGVLDPMANIAGYTYMLDATRIFTASAIDNGYKPAVANAIVKYHFTEKFREIINHGMDILGGAAICRGPRNILAHPYFGTPIAITVEGANIMTRSLIHFGQGAIRCHPYSYAEMKALAENDLDKFDDNFFKHIGHLIRNMTRSILLSLSRGYLYHRRYVGVVGKYEAKLAWSSASFAFLADVALAFYGGSIKRKESLTSRFGDILSYMYLASSVLRRYNAEGHKKEDLDYLDWSMNYCFAEIQAGFSAIFNNLLTGKIGCLFAAIMGFYNRLNPIGTSSSNFLNHKVAKTLMVADKRRDRLTKDIFISEEKNDQLHKLEAAFNEIEEYENIYTKIKAAQKAKIIAKTDSLYDAAVTAKIITKKEYESLLRIEKLLHDAVEVDAF